MMLPVAASRAIREAAEAGDFGEVIRLVRKVRGMTQRQLGDACGYNQSSVSRIERGNASTHDVRTLRRIAQVLEVPPELLGIIELRTASENENEPPVKRRDFLTSTAAVAATAALPSAHRHPHDTSEAIRTITAMQRRLDAVLPSPELVDAMTAHLRMATRQHDGSWDPQERRLLAAAVSEGAGFAGWLHWDMQDLGSARVHYKTAIKAARGADNPTLTAYMLGSLASLTIHEGDASDALGLLRQAAGHLGDEPPATACAWLAATQALAFAALRNEAGAWTALDQSTAAAEQATRDGNAPWPWVFPFDIRKVTSHRLSCAVMLHRPAVAYQAAESLDPFSTSFHLKQRALLLLDLAAAHIQDDSLDQGFRIALQAVEIAAGTRSERIIQRARWFRRQVTRPSLPRFVHDFDDRLRDVAYA